MYAGCYLSWCEEVLFELWQLLVVFFVTQHGFISRVEDQVTGNSFTGFFQISNFESRKWNKMKEI
jgi:hypothetical protein